ncbi:MAG TPA: hypothetical protein VGB75_11645 [Jatrophihabitans sp.]|uniref:hypothetical protein n=1 Tax=Jatrophihabitans sp. TaxID=1932789 RepID=UPI002EF5CCE0
MIRINARKPAAIHVTVRIFEVDPVTSGSIRKAAGLEVETVADWIGLVVVSYHQFWLIGPAGLPAARDMNSDASSVSISTPMGP